MFGFTIIGSAEHEKLVAENQISGDRVRQLEGNLRNADNAFKNIERNLKESLLEVGSTCGQNISLRSQVGELRALLDQTQESSAVLEQSLDQAQEQVANLQKAIAEVRQHLSDSRVWTKELEGQNQNQIKVIARFISQCDEAERERNVLIIEKGVLKACLENYQRNAAIAADNFLLEIRKPILEEVASKH